MAVGQRGLWDPVAKTISCLGCRDTATHEEVESDDIATNSHVDIDVGRPGGSAREEFERRRGRRAAGIEERWGTGRIGRIAAALSTDPQSTRAWEKGAEGEERVARILATRLGTEALLLHDRVVPKTRGNIDHLVVATSGVWIVDAKHYVGKVERRDVGRLRRDDRLFVAGHDRTKLVDGLAWQLAAVRTALDDQRVPVIPSLSFTGAEWPLFFAKPFQLAGVWISWSEKLAELMLVPGPVPRGAMGPIARRLAEALPAKRTTDVTPQIRAGGAG